MSARQYLIENIINFVKRNKPKPIDGWDDIDFNDIESIRLKRNDLFEHELIVLMVELEYQNSNNMLRNEILQKWNERLAGFQNEVSPMTSSTKTQETQEKSKVELSEREELVEEIIEFVNRMKIGHMDGWEDIDFEHIETLRLNEQLLQEELAGLLEELDRLHSEPFIYGLDDTLDALAIVEKYKNGDIGIGKSEIKPFVISNTWRGTIPFVLKTNISDWKTAPIDTFYEQAKETMKTLKGSDLAQVRNFISNISEILYEKEQYEAELAKEYELPEGINDDTISEHIMLMIEIIMLPHIEAIDRYERSGGKINFSDLWEIPFKESLKKEVKDRDGWKCVVCESESDLHVHHKIPRKLGGIHHKHNLVTLCASCHGVIETANIKKAFSKCLINYRRNKAIKSFNKELSVNISVLKDEIAEKLDFLLNALTNKNEALAYEVVEIMARFEVLHHAE